MEVKGGREMKNWITLKLLCLSSPFPPFSHLNSPPIQVIYAFEVVAVVNVLCSMLPADLTTTATFDNIIRQLPSTFITKTCTIIVGSTITKKRHVLF